MNYKSKFSTEQIDALCEAVAGLRDASECYRLFEDLCTIHEIEAMAQRLEVARLLKEGVTYNDIVEATGASTATISRVNRCLHYGADGYQLVLQRSEAKSEE